MQISLFFCMSLDELENNEAILIVYTQHLTHSYMSLYTHGWAKSTQRTLFKTDEHLSNIWSTKPKTWNPLQPRIETRPWLWKPSPYMPKHSPWMSTTNRKVLVSTTDHVSPLSCFGFSSITCKPDVVNWNTVDSILCFGLYVQTYSPFALGKKCMSCYNADIICPLYMANGCTQITRTPIECSCISKMESVTRWFLGFFFNYFVCFLFQGAITASQQNSNWHWNHRDCQM